MHAAADTIFLRGAVGSGELRKNLRKHWFEHRARWDLCGYNPSQSRVDLKPQFALKHGGEHHGERLRHAVELNHTTDMEKPSPSMENSSNGLLLEWPLRLFPDWIIV
jgi:hypothetical protein